MQGFGDYEYDDYEDYEDYGDYGNFEVESIQDLNLRVLSTTRLGCLRFHMLILEK